MSSFKMRNVLLFSFVVAMAACSPAEQGEESTEAVAQVSSLEGSNWQLLKLTVLGGFEFVPDDSSNYVLNFRSQNRLTGTSDCNSITGSWFQENTQLKFEPFSAGRSLCPPGSLHSYLALYLQDVAAYSFRDEHLVLTTPTEGIEIEFEAR